MELGAEPYIRLLPVLTLPLVLTEKGKNLPKRWIAELWCVLLIYLHNTKERIQKESLDNTKIDIFSTDLGSQEFYNQISNSSTSHFAVLDNIWHISQKPQWQAGQCFERCVLAILSPSEKYIYLSLGSVLCPRLLGEGKKHSQIEQSWSLPWKIHWAAHLTLMSSAGTAT